MTTPNTSILLPTHNGAKTIETSIRSVLKQTYTNFELIVIDDASTDNTADIVGALATQDSRIVLIQNKTNLRLPKTLNIGLKAAQGTYIARIDDDDKWIESDKLSKQIAFLEQHSDHVLVGTWFQKIDEHGTLKEEAKPPTDDADIRNIILSRNPFGHSTVLFLREAALACYGYDELLPYTEDYDLWVRLGIKGKFANVPFFSTSYLMRTGGMSHTTSNLRLLRYHFRIIATYFRSYPNRFRALAHMLVNFIFY